MVNKSIRELAADGYRDICAIKCGISVGAICSLEFNKPQLDIVFVEILTSLLEKRGMPFSGNVDPNCSLIDAPARICRRSLLDFVRNRIAIHDYPGLGIEYGQAMCLPLAGIVGQLAMSSATLQHALKDLQTYSSLIGFPFSFTVTKHHNAYEIDMNNLYPRDEVESVKWFVVEAVVAMLMHNATILSATDVRFEKVCLPYRRSSLQPRYTEYFGCKVEYDCDSLRLHVSEAMMHLPTSSRNDTVYAFVQAEAAMKLGRFSQRQLLEEKIFSLLGSQTWTIPSQEKISQKLNMSSSSLYRKLSDAGSGYQKIVDRYRFGIAVEMLRDNTDSIRTISERLLFTDVSSFIKAFKKWTGITPAQFREF